jgi:dTDP-4-amino-4,6-dideoxygalactose transaminase
MGLANLKYIEAIHQKRKLLFERYNEMLKNFKARKPSWHKDANNNFSYYPIIFESEQLMLKCIETLKLNEIGTRRYFYPSLATALPYLVPQNMSITDEVSKRVLCLPFYYDLTKEEIDHICRLLLRVQNN